MKVWIHINGIQEGPYELGELPLNRIKPDTPVWYEGLDYWKEASQAPEVARFLSRAVSPQQSVQVETVDPTDSEELEVTSPDVTEPEEIENTAEVSSSSDSAGAIVPEHTESTDVPEEIVDKEESVTSVTVDEEPVISAVMEEEEKQDPAAIAQEEAETVRTLDDTACCAAEDESLSQEQSNGEQPYNQQPYNQQSYNQQFYNQQSYSQPPYAGNSYYQSGAYNPAGQTGEDATTYLIWAILVTLLCCNPIGIIAIVTAMITRRRNSNYDYAGAKRMSEVTAWWIMIVIVTSLIMAPFMSIVSI